MTQSQIINSWGLAFDLLPESVQKSLLEAATAPENICKICGKEKSFEQVSQDADGNRIIFAYVCLNCE